MMRVISALHFRGLIGGSLKKSFLDVGGFVVVVRAQTTFVLFRKAMAKDAISKEQRKAK